MIPYKKQFTFEERKGEASRVRKKYPTRIPIIVEYLSKTNFKTYFNNKNNNIQKLSNRNKFLDKRKYLVPNDITGSQFNYVIRKRIKLEPHNAIFLFVNGKTLLDSQRLLSETYEEYKDKDGFLYIYYDYERTFG